MDIVYNLERGPMRKLLFHVSFSWDLMILERHAGFEPAAFSLATKNSTTELIPHFLYLYNT
jgi:hypothetical protein